MYLSTIYKDKSLVRTNLLSSYSIIAIARAQRQATYCMLEAMPKRADSIQLFIYTLFYYF